MVMTNIVMLFYCQDDFVIQIAATIRQTTTTTKHNIRKVGLWGTIRTSHKVLILLSNKSPILQPNTIDPSTISRKDWGYFFEGFLVEFLNPLAFTFFVSIMTIIINPQETWNIKIVYWIEIIILGSIWFFTVALVLSSEKITFYTKKFSKLLEILAGITFILFGSKMFYI